MKAAIILGASSGIGRELCPLLAADGYRLGIAARRLELLHALRENLPHGVIAKQIDLAEPRRAQAALYDLIEELRDVELFVICAGVGHINPDLAWDMEYDTLATNVVGFAAAANVAMRYFRRRRHGHLVGLSSIAALRGSAAAPAYAASKAFVSNYLAGLRRHARRAGCAITVTEVQPGFVDTRMAQGDGLFWLASPQTAARQIHRAIRRRTPHVYVTKRWRIIAWLLRALPETWRPT